MRRAVCICVIAMLACSGKKQPEPPPAPPPAPKPARADAGITAIKGYDPASGMHLDDDTAGTRVLPPPPDRPGRPIEITLRSTPPGAQAVVDGTLVGNTPAFWAGEANGQEHEFTFVLPGHALARYRFVPVSSGVLHARLEPIAEEPGTIVPPGIADPTPAPAVVPAPAPVPPPATLVTPDAPAPVMPSSSDAPAVQIGPQP